MLCSSRTAVVYHPGSKDRCPAELGILWHSNVGNQPPWPLGGVLRPSSWRSSWWFGVGAWWSFDYLSIRLSQETLALLEELRSISTDTSCKMLQVWGQSGVNVWSMFDHGINVLEASFHPFVHGIFSLPRVLRLRAFSWCRMFARSPFGCQRGAASHVLNHVKPKKTILRNGWPSPKW